MIIAVYNGEDHVAGCVESLKAQTHRDLDIIFVVDSKTTDRSLEYIETLTRGWDSVRIIVQTDDGRLPGARNLGLEVMGGDWVWCLDVDDRPYPTLVEDLLRVSEDSSADVAICNSIFTANRGLPEKVYGQYGVKTYSGIEAAIAVCEGELSPSPWCKLYSVGFLKKFNLVYSIGLCEDIDFTIRAFIHANKVAYYNKPLYLYYQHESSMCGGSNDDAIAERDVELAGLLSEQVLMFHPDYYGRFCASMGRHAIRSMTRASEEGFRRISKSPVLSKLLSYRQSGFHPEVTLYKISPWLFYRIGRRARNHKFSKDPLLFDDRF